MSVCRSGWSCRSNCNRATPSGRGALVVNGNGVAQPWPELPALIERFLELNFLVVRREEAQVTEYWCPYEAVKEQRPTS